MTDSTTTEAPEATETEKPTTEEQLRAKAAKLAAAAAAANAELLELTNPELRELTQTLREAQEAHKPFNRLIILRKNRIATAERRLAELTAGRFEEDGETFKVTRAKSGTEAEGEPNNGAVIDNGLGLTQLLESQAAAAEKVAEAMSALEAAKVANSIKATEG